MSSIIKAANYQVEIGSLTDSSLQELLVTRYADSKKIILVDENTHDYCLEYLLTAFSSLEEAEVMLLPAGEENKVMEVCFQVWEAWSEYQIGRKDLIINLGGGLVSDMGGFMASVFKRGLDFINIPTSLLAMADASVGGKTGIDMGNYKNQLGVFADPVAVYIDPGFLATLPPEERKNGWAEMLKHGLIISETHWKKVKETDVLAEDLSPELIIETVTVKNEIVLKDPQEQNVRKKLNFGHTFGHAIEGILLHEENALPHGHAVAIGILAEAYISTKKGLLSPDEFEEIEKVIVNHYAIPVFPIAMAEQLFLLMKNDKKNSHNKVSCVLLKKIGEAVIDQEIGEEDVRDVLEYLDAL